MSKQKGFFTEDLRLSEISQHGDPLQKLNAMIPWENFRHKLNRILIKESKGPGGRPPYDYVMMFKILVLQRIYNLSDSQMQYQIMDRLSFMRFLGLNLDDKVPDEKTISHFREELVESKKLKIIFEQFRNYLIKEGILLESGTIVDASFVEVPKQRNNKDENKEIKESETPKDWSDNKLRQKDVDARWATKGGRRHYGYKNHIKNGSSQEFETEFRSWKLTHTMIKSKFVSFDSTKSICTMRNNLCFIIQTFNNSIGNRNFKII